MDLLKGDIPGGNFSFGSIIDGMRGQKLSSPISFRRSGGGGSGGGSFDLYSMLGTGANMFGNLASMITSLGGIGGSISSLFGSKKARRRAIAEQKDLMNYSAQIQDQLIQKQNQYNLESWNRENEYNSPMAQMERLRAAGLNPNLIYGSSSSGASGNAGSISSGNSVNLSSDAAGNQGALAALASRQADLSFMTQIRNVESQTKLNDSLANKANEEAGQVAPNSEMMRKLQASESDLIQSQKGQVDEFVKQMPDRFKAELNEIWSRYELNEKQRDYCDVNIAVARMNYRKLGLEADQIDKYIREIMPELVKDIQERYKLSKQQAIYYAAGAFYMTSAAMVNLTQADVNRSIYDLNHQEFAFKSRLYHQPHYFIGQVNKDYINTYLAKENISLVKSNTWFNEAKTYSELLGYPYVQSGLFGSGLFAGRDPKYDRNLYEWGNSFYPQIRYRFK